MLRLLVTVVATKITHLNLNQIIQMKPAVFLLQSKTIKVAAKPEKDQRVGRINKSYRRKILTWPFTMKIYKKNKLSN